VTAYLVTSGVIFGLIGAMHLIMLLQAALHRVPGWMLDENAPLAALSLGLATWALLLMRRTRFGS
jgi:hypothetical protein